MRTSENLFNGMQRQPTKTVNMPMMAVGVSGSPQPKIFVTMMISRMGRERWMG